MLFALTYEQYNRINSLMLQALSMLIPESISRQCCHALIGRDIRAAPRFGKGGKFTGRELVLRSLTISFNGNHVK